MIDFAPPSMSSAEEEAVLRVLRSGWLSSGKQVEAFEQEIEALVGRRAYATSSATMGFQILLLALGVGPGWKACFPAVTFSGVPMQAFMMGATVQFVDIDENGFMDMPADWSSAAKQIVVPTHLAGAVASIPKIQAGIGDALLIEDCAHLYPGFRSNGYVAGACQVADYAFFSFYPTKCVATAEGGAVTVAHELALAAARLHGFDRDAASRQATNSGPDTYDVVGLGTKANMSDVAAAIACVQLQRREELHKRRSEAASRYVERLANSPIEVLHAGQRIAGQHADHLMVVRFPSHAERNAHAARLADERIRTSLHFQALHTFTFWRDQIEAGAVEVSGDLQNADAYAQCSLSLPLFPDLSKSQVDHICDILLKSTT